MEGVATLAKLITSRMGSRCQVPVTGTGITVDEQQEGAIEDSDKDMNESSA